MFATADQIEDLLELQAVQVRKNQAEKEFKELPQRQAILEIRQKRVEVEGKRAQVEELLKKAAADVQRISDEDERQARKQKEAEEAISAGEGNYRAVEARSKELNAIAKQRATLSQKHDAALAQLQKVKGVAEQIIAALNGLDKKEAAETDSFKQQGSALQREIAQLQAESANLMAALPPEVAAEFTKTAERCAGVAVGRLQGDRCGCCRTPLDDAHLRALKAQAPLGACPSCKRLLVI